MREALKQLAIMGLVVCRPNRGTIVAEMSSEQLDQMFEAIGELEAACALMRRCAWPKTIVLACANSMRRTAPQCRRATSIATTR